MSKVTGVVEAVSTKWDKYSIQVNGGWYGTKMEWAKEKPVAGDTVEFDDGGGKFTKYLKITGSGGAVPAKAGAAKAGGYSNVGVQMGHAYNNAMALVLACKGESDDMDEVLTAVTERTIEIYQLTERLRKLAETGSLVVEEEEVL